MKVNGQSAIDSLKAKARQLRGQSAIEFLFTYGWALVLILATFAALYYYGIFDAVHYLPRQCSIQPSLPCDSFGFQVNESSAEPLKFILLTHNGLGYRVSTTSFMIHTENVGVSGKKSYPGECIGVDGSSDIPTGAYIYCSANITDSDRIPRIGDSVTVQFTLSYENLETSVEHSVQGTLTTQAEAETPIVLPTP